MALGVLHVLHERGIEVPGQIAVVGFDGMDEGAFFTPSLTTVRQPLRELGQLAVRELLATLGEPPGRIVAHALTLATELVVRDSAPAAAAAAAAMPTAAAAPTTAGASRSGRSR
jgi:LacI family transcriptional regulator